MNLVETIGLKKIASVGLLTNPLPQVLSLVTWAVTFLGGFLVVWGAIQLGLAIRQQQGGNAIAEAIATIGGGAVIVAAAAYFGTLNTSPV